MSHDMPHEESQKSFKDTLNLPRTDFPIRAQHAESDKIILHRWKKENLYQASYNHNNGNEKFILHDGPPYANGSIHLGHAYNKILKDIVTKSRRMLGFHVPVIPGWDCHGLPIEKKVTEQHPGLDRIALKKACREYASHWINVQREEFKSLGVLMNWSNPYITMSPEYEAATVKAFGMLVAQGFIERKNKTVPWCFHDQTVLATAEIEYKDRKDPSIYALFGIDTQDAERLFGVSVPTYVVVWTTTPWTLPLNQAVMAKPQAEYVLLEGQDANYVVGAEVADQICALAQIEKRVREQFSSSKLTGLKLSHPFVDKYVPLIFDESVGTNDGTAFVHCAPGCGPIDYEIGVKNNLEIYSPISDDGRYTDAILPQDLAGMLVTDGQIWVIKKLAELGKLFIKKTINHSYPHCWRCHNGLIFRATPQWFFDLNRQNVKIRALQAIDAMDFIPDRGRNFLRATVEHRWEWCLSRQRAWGTPIPAVLCKGCDYSVINQDMIDFVARGIEKEGIEFWDRVALADILPADFSCPGCKGTDFKKEQDILDVWFDAGVSHYAVLYGNKEQRFPADMYLEGVDQHRGWFQSSLITSLVLEQEACTKSIMTHGYTVDAKGQKMSKSLGNVVAPQDIVKKYGTDGLRLWVATIGNDSDPVVSDTLFANVSEVHRKIRNTCRFMLSNLYDFEYEKDHLPLEQLLPLDQYALSELVKVNDTIVKAYLASNFTVVFHTLSDYCATELSSLYFDVIKDRLYADQAQGVTRRSAQTVVWHILDTLTHLMAPILSFTAELISDFYQVDKKKSIHLQSFTDLSSVKQSADIKAINPVYWDALKELRSLILKAIEPEREKAIIKHSLEARIVLSLNTGHALFERIKPLFDEFEKRGMTVDAFMKEFVIVSQFEYKPDMTIDGGVSITVERAQGTKCPRCWQYDTITNEDGLCRRCQLVLHK